MSSFTAISIQKPFPTFAVSVSGGGAMIPVYSKERRHLSLLERPIQIPLFLLVSDSLKAYPIRELEFRDCKTFARVPPRAIDGGSTDGTINYCKSSLSLSL